jgi:hypothetical protein
MQMDSALNIPTDLSRKRRTVLIWLSVLTAVVLSSLYFNLHIVINEVSHTGKITNIVINRSGKYRRYSTVYLTTPKGFVKFGFNSNDPSHFSAFNKAIKRTQHLATNQPNIKGYSA